jgi:hypothetical protein
MSKKDEGLVAERSRPTLQELLERIRTNSDPNSTARAVEDLVERSKKKREQINRVLSHTNGNGNGNPHRQ